MSNNKQISFRKKSIFFSLKLSSPVADDMEMLKAYI